MWALSFRLGTYFGDSKKGTEDGGVRFKGSEVTSKKEVRKENRISCEGVEWREKLGRLLGKKKGDYKDKYMTDSGKYKGKQMLGTDRNT